MLPRHKLVTVTALALAAGLLVAWLAGCQQTCPPCPDCPDCDIPTEGTTNLSDLVLSGDLTVGDDLTITDDGTCTDDWRVLGDLTVSGSTKADGGISVDTTAFTVADTTGNTVIGGTADIKGNISSSSSAITLTDNVFLDGAANAVQILVQEYTTPTNAALTIEDSSGTDVVSFQVAPVAAGSFDLLDLTDTMAIQNGSDTVIGIDLNLTGANHTGSSNAIYGLDLDLTTADAQADEIAIELSDTDWDTGIKGAYDLEHIGLPTIANEAITYQSTGALWTITDGEIWYIHAVFCDITTNFDCTGDNCTVDLGDGGDQDGLLDLDDAELQTADTEGTGAPAGWQGIMGNATRGAYLAEGIGFVYAPSGADETIDITVGGTDPAAGAGTCYLVYTRLE